MKNIYSAIEKRIAEHYVTSEYPALSNQIISWKDEKPLSGISILDATPVFRNTMTKYMALLAAGAELSVGLSDVMPYDPRIVGFLQSIGIGIVRPDDENLSFDIILDCAGSFSQTEARLGYVELTRSGIERYADCKKPVFVADSGKIKQIETLLGTGESLFRALKSFGYTDWSGKKVILFGSGKVGSGIVLYGHSMGAQIVVVSEPSTISTNVASRCSATIDYRDANAVLEAVRDADLIVTATGIRDAIANRETCRAIAESSAILANMGVEDEFGADIPTKRVLNDKKPLNFILEEPTHLKYIETTMALHNSGALYIIKNPNSAGIINPPATIEDDLLRITNCNGVISAELNLIDGLNVDRI